MDRSFSIILGMIKAEYGNLLIQRDNYYKIDSLFEKHKKNSDKGLIIEIFDEKEQQKFFLEQMSKITEKLYNIYNDNNFKEIKKIKMNKNKVVYVSVWENNPIVSASNTVPFVLTRVNLSLSTAFGVNLVLLIITWITDPFNPLFPIDNGLLITTG